MRIFSIGILSGVTFISGAFAQTVVPASPREFTTRPIGGSSAGGASVTPSKQTPQKVRYTTHMILSDLRQWTSNDGRTLDAKLIAFEDLVAEIPEGATKPVLPAPPPHPTVVRDGKIRLFGNKKAYTLPLDRLSEPDREFVEKIRAAHAAPGALTTP